MPGFVVPDSSSTKGRPLRVEGVSISGTARVTSPSRNTIARWLCLASTSRPVSTTGYSGISELQADELRTFVGDETRTRWLFAVLEVSSRLGQGASSAVAPLATRIPSSTT